MKSFSFGRRLATVAAAASLVLLGPAATADAGPAAAEPAAAEPAAARAAGARAAGATAAGAGAAGATAAGARAAGADAAPIRVMPLGDSITYGVGSSALDSYRGDLFWRLARAGVPVDYVGSMRSGISPLRRSHKSFMIIDAWRTTSWFSRSSASRATAGPRR